VYIIIVFVQIPSFLQYNIFSLQAQSLFKQAAICLSFLLSNVSHSKQALNSHYYLPANFCLPSQMRSESFLIFLLYIKPLFPINKQFSIDSFLDLEGHRKDSCSSHHLLTLYSSQPTLLANIVRRF